MRTAVRIAISAPPGAARTRVSRPGPRAPAGAHACERGRDFVSALLGALAGLAVGTAFVAVAPVVGRAATVDAAGAEVRSSGPGDQVDGARAASVSAVLAPAIEAGVVPAPDHEASGP